MTRERPEPDLVAHVRAAASAAGLPQAPAPLLVLASGGRDSTCLLDVAVALSPAPGTVGVLHVNYALRPEADEDEEQLRATCAALRVELAVERAPAPPASGNLQAWARDLRYEAARRSGAATVLVGHTASDLAETVLYRLAASRGRRALLGLRERSGDVLRPLLSVTREQTARYCELRDLAWREDSSNGDERFARTRVRNGLLPALRAIHPAAEANVLATARRLADEQQVLDELVARTLDGRGEIALERLRELPPALARLVVVRLAEQAGPLHGDVAARVEELMALRDHAELHLGRGLRAVVRRGVLRMAVAPDRRREPIQPGSREPTSDSTDEVVD